VLPLKKGPFLEERAMSSNNFIRGKSYVLLGCVATQEKVKKGRIQ